MPETAYKLDVQDPLEERQIRRLGAAAFLIWPSLPPEMQARLLDVAASIEISGERIGADELRAKLDTFVGAGVLTRTPDH